MDIVILIMLFCWIYSKWYSPAERAEKERNKQKDGRFEIRNLEVLLFFICIIGVTVGIKFFGIILALHMLIRFFLYIFKQL